MNQLLNEWRKFLSEQINSESDKDIKFSDDVYAQMVFLVLGDSEDALIKKNRIEKISQKAIMFPKTQLIQAIGEAKQIIKDLNYLFKLLPKEERKYLMTTYLGWASGPPYFSLREIFAKRAELEENKNILSCFSEANYSLKLYKYIGIPYGIRDPGLQNEIDKINEDAVGAYDLLEKFRSYKKIADIQDPEERHSLLTLLREGARDGSYTKMVESMISSLVS